MYAINSADLQNKDMMALFRELFERPPPYLSGTFL